MPTSHDAKPRMKHRRLKGRIGTGHALPLPPFCYPSERGARKRYARQLAMEVERARTALEKSARKDGISWRQIEVTCHRYHGGQWAKMAEAMARLSKEKAA